MSLPSALLPWSLLLRIIAIPALTRRMKRSETNPRSIKIVMSNLNEKEMVMSNLGKLKKCCVTDDYTAEERDTIKNKVTEARNKSEAEGGGIYIWKVRGSPKNGLCFIRFPKSRPRTSSKPIICETLGQL